MLKRLGFSTERNVNLALQRRTLQRKPALLDWCAKRLAERRLHVTKQNPVLRTLRTGETGLHGGHIERKRVRKLRLRPTVRAEQTLLFGIALDEVDQIVGTGRLTKVVERFAVDREEAHRSAVFRTHVGHRRSVGQGHTAKPIAKELDELPNNALCTKHFDDRQHQIGGRRPFRQPTRKTKSNNLRNQHVDRLTQHDRLRFDAAHAPPDHAKTVDHRCVTVGSDEAIRHGHRRPVHVPRSHHRREVFQVDLVNDTRGRRNHSETVERLLPPAEKLIAFSIPQELTIGVDPQRLR